MNPDNDMIHVRPAPESNATLFLFIRRSGGRRFYMEFYIHWCQFDDWRDFADIFDFACRKFDFAFEHRHEPA